MPSWLPFDRLLLLLSLTVLLWNVQATRNDRRAAELLAAEVGALKELVAAEAAREPAKAQPCPACPVCPAPAEAPRAPSLADALARATPTSPDGATTADPAAAPRGRTAFKDRKRLAEMPGNVLNRLYDATDRMADDEQWDDATYDQVTAVFEESAARATELFAGMRDGSVTEAQAREQAIGLRDETTQRLETVLGPDGLTRLKGYMGRR